MEVHEGVAKIRSELTRARSAASVAEARIDDIEEDLWSPVMARIEADADAIGYAKGLAVALELLQAHSTLVLVGQG